MKLSLNLVWKKFKISRIHIQFVKKIYETKNFCNKRTMLINIYTYETGNVLYV